MTSNLGLADTSGKKAELGNIVHKALELLARKKLALQKKESSFSDPEISIIFNTLEFNPEEAIATGWNHYTDSLKTIHSWEEGDRKKAKKWVWDVLLYNNGMFNPLNREIVMPEEYFDMEIPEEWARYEYTIPGEKGTFSGQLRIKGTMDLVTRVKKGLIEYVDWKTGLRKDWTTGKEKDYEGLRKDFQMRLYHYALCKLYPKDDILMTIFFVQAGGAFTLFLDRSHLGETESLIKTYFQAIQMDDFPRRVKDSDPGSWKCSRLCAFHADEWADSGKSSCQFFREQILSIGLENVTAKYKISKTPWGSYGSGGGVTDRKEEK